MSVVSRLLGHSSTDVMGKVYAEILSAEVAKLYIKVVSFNAICASHFPD